MDDPKPFASLGATLLARKGGARPAMRPQNETRVTAANLSPLDDLGWNDMGDDGHSGSQNAAAPVPIRPMDEADHGAAPEPEVRRQQEVLARKVADTATETDAETATETTAETPAPVKAETPAKPAMRKAKAAAKAVDARRAAFTLRLDPERHLKLRLASTIRNRSAQHIVTEALDKLLAEMPELTALARQVSKN